MFVRSQIVKMHCYTLIVYLSTYTLMVCGLSKVLVNVMHLCETFVHFNTGAFRNGKYNIHLVMAGCMLLACRGFDPPCLRTFRFGCIRQGCANFFNGGPNTNKHNILRAAPSNRIIFYRISKTILPAIKIKLQ